MTVESRCGGLKDQNSINIDNTINNDNNHNTETIEEIVRDSKSENVAVIINEVGSNIQAKNGQINGVKSSCETTAVNLDKNETNIDRNGRRRENEGTSDDKLNAFQTSVLDLAFSSFIISPLAVLYWRGTFNYISFKAFKGRPAEEKIVHALLLYNTGLFLKISLDVLKAVINVNSCILNTKTKFIIKFLLLYCDSLFGVILWVGGFNLLYLGPQLFWYTLTTVLVCSSLCMMWLEAFHGTGGSPLIVATDSFKDVINSCGYFETKFEDGRKKFVADIALTYAVVHPLMICCWWGLWELENNFILQKMEITEKDIQAWDSIFIVIIMVILIKMLQRRFEEQKREGIENYSRVKNNFLAFLGLISAVNYWRGVWSLLNFYFFPQMAIEENFIMSHVVGFHLLYILGAASNLTMSSVRDSSKPVFQDYQYFAKKEVVYNEEEGGEEERTNLL